MSNPYRQRPTHPYPVTTWHGMVPASTGEA